MKTLIKIIVIGLIFFGFSSCFEEENITSQNPNEAIAVLKEGKFILIKDNQQILSLITNKFYPSKFMSFSSIETFEHDGNYYVRIRDSENLVSTTLLNMDNEGFFEIGNIACESVACATNNGCIPNPNGTSCTECWYVEHGSSDPKQGDCKKIVTGPSNPGTGTNS